ncbi:fatty acid cis/trans isomerase [Ideonella azotifigens]|uniref:Fatty acid cis/trans isomerase n=1 Tax=Ideonella azotifigens TaxID=513160 RepID=A0ABP3V015_9BURK|nr:fatty acid cis/trans isomerase [Ideonella azotifigens]MCD2340262.1 fatty acid cis/trans isomerase [Ideonella azotifigens]
MRRFVFLLVAISLLAACATLVAPALDPRFGPADPTRFDHPAPPPAGESYALTVQPILDRRCVVCHACYDAPCQLKTTSWEGMTRGANKTPVYDATRLLAAPPSRLYVDAQLSSEWRTRGFFPVLNEQDRTPEANRSVGLVHRMLMLKQQHPWPAESADETAQQAALDVSADRAAMCPAGTEMDGYERSLPQGGMPYGLPGLPAAEHRVLTRWIEQGAPAEAPAPLPAATQQQVARWEQFFNGDALKTQLFARYAYEHLFLAHLYFDGDGAAPQRFFKLVRSATPPGQPLKVIPTARPVDDPAVGRVYYRLDLERETLVAKTHMPYRLDAQRMARWRTLFLDAPYTVDRLPGYSADTAANPFATFAALPVGARYRFMLDEAEFTIMGFIKGPVCRGQIALDVIEDQFWVSFLAPSEAYDNAMAKLLQQDVKLMSLPTGRSNTDVLVAWLAYGRLESGYLKARTAQYTEALQKPENLTEQLIWDGEGHNDNAALTVFRHFDSASVVKGFVGESPKTAWVIGYPLLERIHYLLVANYDVYGNLGHQLNSRLYMDYLRAEGEFNFLALLPQAQRIPTRNHWYRGVGEGGREQVYGGPGTTLPLESGIHYTSANPQQELYDLLKKRLAPVLDHRFDWTRHSPAALRAPLQALATLQGASLQWLPEMTLLQIDQPDGSASTWTLLRNTAHASVSHLLGEQKELLPAENTLTLAPGVIGSYPNVLLRVKASDLPALTTALQQLRAKADFDSLARRWAVRRTHPDFWAFSDTLHRRYAHDDPLGAGMLDYNRLGAW